MAKQIGIIKIKGTIGDLSFYDSKFGPLVRKAGGGFNGKAIKTKASMIRVRENASEFGRVAKVKFLFRMGLEPFLGNCKDPSRHARMMRVLQEIKTYDSVSVRGKRDVVLGLTTPMGKKLWHAFDLTERSAFHLLPGTYRVDAVTQVLTVSDLDNRTVVFPKGATLLEVKYGILEFDFETMEFKLFSASSLFLEKDFMDTAITLPLIQPVLGVGMLFPVVGIRFYQEVGGERYLFKEAIWQGVNFL